MGTNRFEHVSGVEPLAKGSGSVVTALDRFAVFHVLVHTTVGVTGAPPTRTVWRVPASLSERGWKPPPPTYQPLVVFSALAQPSPQPLPASLFPLPPAPRVLNSLTLLQRAPYLLLSKLASVPLQGEVPAAR